MVLISSKTLVQAHAVFLVVVAGYLVKNPEVITDSDLVFMMGEALRIVRSRNIPNSHVNFYRIGNEFTYIIDYTNAYGAGFPIPVKPTTIPLHLLCHTHLHRIPCRPRPAL